MKHLSQRVFFVVGTACVIAGGLVAAVTGPLSLASGSWLAAFLVLVCGVAQCALGVAQGELAAREPSTRVFVAELVAWNVGNAAVITGTLVRQPIVVDVGGALLVIALALMLATVARSATTRLWMLWSYRALVAILLVSIPIGLILAALRAS